MKCPFCGSDTRMHVNVLLSAPSSFHGNLWKKIFRRKDVYLISANWEATDFICTNTECNTVIGGYGNYVSNLRKENTRMKEKLEELGIVLEG